MAYFSGSRSLARPYIFSEIPLKLRASSGPQASYFFDKSSIAFRILSVILL